MTETDKHILVVDDNEEIHQDIRSILLNNVFAAQEELAGMEEILFGQSDSESAGGQTCTPVYQIDHAYQGEEAISMVNDAVQSGQPYSLIFMDVRMPPGMDGIKAIRHIWENHPFTEIVICTAYSDYSWDQIIRDLGASDKLLFMKKPFDATAIKQTALTMTTKWKLQQESLRYTEQLEMAVSERTKELHELLERFKKMKESAERAAELKGEFLANMSHEIRTPLSGIIGVNDLLTQTNLDDEQQEYCQMIETSTNALLSILNETLDLSKLEAGKMEIEEIPFRLDDLLKDITRLMNVSARGKEIEIDYVIDDQIPDQVIGDPTRIRQILMNYGNNAVKFTQEGTIRFHAKLLKDEEEYVLTRFLVEDTGHGIEEDKLETIFEPYSQAKSSDSRKYGGTGLGLTICRQLAELMSGDVGVESTPGQGSTFRFTVKLGRYRKTGTNSTDPESNGK